MILRRKTCPKPPPREYSDHELASVRFPDKQKVMDKLHKIVNDENVKLILKNIIETIYSMNDNSEFIKWVKTNALRYNLASRENMMIDYMLAMSLAFAAYCTEKLYNGSIMDAALGRQANLENLDEPACIVIIDLVESIRQEYVGSQIGITGLMRMARKWKKETDKVKKLWYEIEKNWCR